MQKAYQVLPTLTQKKRSELRLQYWCNAPQELRDSCMAIVEDIWPILTNRTKKYCKRQGIKSGFTGGKDWVAAIIMCNQGTYTRINEN